MFLPGFFSATNEPNIYCLFYVLVNQIAAWFCVLSQPEIDFDGDIKIENCLYHSTLIDKVVYRWTFESYIIPKTVEIEIQFHP